jgi:hypothetical protein
MVYFKTLTVIKLHSVEYLDHSELTPRSRVLPEKIKDPKLLKKFPAVNGIRRFMTTFTRARHLFLA